jgi:hypothetical protein
MYGTGTGRNGRVNPVIRQILPTMAKRNPGKIRHFGRGTLRALQTPSSNPGSNTWQASEH